MGDVYFKCTVNLIIEAQNGSLPVGLQSSLCFESLSGKDEISTDLILMLDEIYLQKAAQYQAGGYVGVDEEGNQYKGITAFIVLELKI